MVIQTSFLRRSHTQSLHLIQIVGRGEGTRNPEVPIGVGSNGVRKTLKDIIPQRERERAGLKAQVASEKVWKQVLRVNVGSTGSSGF